MEPQGGVQGSSGWTPLGEDVALQPPPPPSLPTSSSSAVPLESVQENLDFAEREAPEGSVLKEIGETVRNLTPGDLIFGISGKELNENLKKAWKTDGNLPLPLRTLKMAARGAGLVTGLLLNFVSRIVAFAAAAVAAPGVMVWYSIGFVFLGPDSTIWENPREVLKMMAGLGIGAGAAVGALVGSLGNLLVKTAVSMEYEKGTTVFSKAMEDGSAAALAGSLLGTAISCVNPLFIRALWVPDSDLYQ